MRSLAGQILTLARADSDKLAVTEIFDVADVVRRVAADTDYEARQSGRTVVVRDSAEAIVRGDAALVASAIENVVRNGSRYTPEGTSVDISIASTATHAHIVVRDHGPGVLRGEIDRIFLPFYRVGASRDRDSGGTGLGLSIAARAAAVHGGTIRATNSNDGGLEVAIDLPLYKALHSLAVS